MSEGLDDENPRHDGTQRKVPLKPELSHGHALVPDDAVTRYDLSDAIDEHEWPTMRQDL